MLLIASTLYIYTHTYINRWYYVDACVLKFVHIQCLLRTRRSEKRISELSGKQTSCMDARRRLEATTCCVRSVCGARPFEGLRSRIVYLYTRNRTRLGRLEERTDGGAANDKQFRRRWIRCSRHVPFTTCLRFKKFVLRIFHLCSAKIDHEQIWRFPRPLDTFFN